jgi:hypothetical protein
MHANDYQAQGVHPFFEMWKRKQFQNDSVFKWMNEDGSMMTISDVENSIKPKVNFSQANYFQTADLSFAQQDHRFIQALGMNSRNLSLNPPNNWHDRTHGGNMFQPGQIPTPEQLQQHTSEIMRNAIMRKQRKFQK